MPEPLAEDVEESWLEFMNRFTVEIYPAIFKPYGCTMPEALLMWQLSKMEQQLDAIRQALVVDDNECQF